MTPRAGEFSHFILFSQKNTFEVKQNYLKNQLDKINYNWAFDN